MTHDPKDLAAEMRRIVPGKDYYAELRRTLHAKFADVLSGDLKSHPQQMKYQDNKLS